MTFSNLKHFAKKICQNRANNVYYLLIKLLGFLCLFFFRITARDCRQWQQFFFLYIK